MLILLARERSSNLGELAGASAKQWWQQAINDQKLSHRREEKVAAEVFLAGASCHESSIGKILKEALRVIVSYSRLSVCSEVRCGSCAAIAEGTGSHWTFHARSSQDARVCLLWGELVDRVVSRSPLAFRTCSYNCW